MFRKFANALAIVFHPVFMGTMVLLAFAAKRDGLPVSYMLIAMALILLFTLVIPVAGTYLLHKDIHLKNRSQRFWPLVITFISHVTLYFMLKPFYSQKLLMIGVILLTINLLVLFAFTSFIKASMHANAITIVMCIYIIAYGILTNGQLLNFQSVPAGFYLSFGILFLLFCITIWQRLVSEAHTLSELIAGFFSGLASVGLTLIYIERFGF